MIIYRIVVKTSPTGGTFMDGTASLELAIREAQQIQNEYPDYVVTIEAENWPTLTKLKYFWCKFTRRDEGFGVEFQRNTGHKHSATNKVWPASQATPIK